MIDWTDKIARRTPVCHRSGQPIPPGSVLYSALVFTGEHFERRDVLEEHWPGTDTSGFTSWWLHRLPAPRGDDKPNLLNADQVLQIFLDLAPSRSRPQQCLAYCLALLLMRAKKLRCLGVDPTDAEGVRLIYENRADRSVYRLIDPRMDAGEVARVQDELVALIGY